MHLFTEITEFSSQKRLNLTYFKRMYKKQTLHYVTKTVIKKRKIQLIFLFVIILRQLTYSVHLFVCLFKHSAMKTCGGGGIDPLNHNRDTRWKLLVIFMLRMPDRESPVNNGYKVGWASESVWIR
jgi:hypothetical protein